MASNKEEEYFLIKIKLKYIMGIGKMEVMSNLKINDITLKIIGQLC